jgi:hypothetical protein
MKGMGAFHRSNNSKVTVYKNEAFCRVYAARFSTEIWDKYWQAIFVKVRLKISHRKNLSETERHYSYWLLKS